jgi:hypothetical protein
MYGSITRLELKSEQDLRAAVQGLEKVLSHARELAGFRDCYVLRTGSCQLTMVTTLLCLSSGNLGGCRGH